MSSAAPSPSDAPLRRRPTTPRGRLVRAGAVCLVLGGLLVSGVPLCPFAYLSGYPCPGCGLTRAGLALLHGRWADAVAWSPLSPFVVPFAAAVAVRAFVTYLRGEAQLPPRWIIRGALGVWVALLIVWLMRFGGWFGGPVTVTSLWSR